MKLKELFLTSAEKSQTEEGLRLILKNSKKENGFLHEGLGHITKKVELDGLNYTITLYKKVTRNPNIHIYTLSFKTKEHDGGITNAGISTFNKLSQEIMSFVKKTQESKEITALISFSSGIDLTPEKEKKESELFREFRKKIERNPSLFGGFSKEKEEERFSVENKTLTYTDRYGVKTIITIDKLIDGEITLKESQTWITAALFREFFKNHPDQGLIQKLTRPSSSKSKQRTLLYKRTLQQSFKDYEFEEFKENYLIIYLDKEKKGEVCKSLTEIEQNLW